ncbi:hypothetical protein GCM10017562_27140 [Streptomyces roseofulvus]
MAPSVQAARSRSHLRAVTANRKRATEPATVSRYSTAVATFPTSVTVVSFISEPLPVASCCHHAGDHAESPPASVDDRRAVDNSDTPAGA